MNIYIYIYYIYMICTSIHITTSTTHAFFSVYPQKKIITLVDPFTGSKSRGTAQSRAIKDSFNVTSWAITIISLASHLDSSTAPRIDVFCQIGFFWAGIKRLQYNQSLFLRNPKPAGCFCAIQTLDSKESTWNYQCPSNGNRFNILKTWCLV